MSILKDREPEPRSGSAPALDKGLDVLEVLATEPAGLTQKQLAQRVGRSVGEIFRMLGTLERRGYIVRDPKTGEYALTLQLFQLAMQYPRTRRLEQVALPVMDALALRTGHACHLSMVNGEQFVVIAQAEPPRQMGWRVKLGAAFPVSMEYVSARILAAFQSGHRREEMVRILAERSALPADQVSLRLEAIAAAGYDLVASEVAAGITDLSAPILDRRGDAVAALTMPFMPSRGIPAQLDEITGLMRAAAHEISLGIGGRKAGEGTAAPVSATSAPAGSCGPQSPG